MGINKNFYAPQREIKWDDVVVCTVRGVTPNDIARIFNENAADVETLVNEFQRDKTLQSLRDTDDVGAAITENSSKIFEHIMKLVPNLAAKIIAVAASEPENADHVRDQFVLPLQFDALTQIAELTFINEDGFKKFLGNVTALAGSFGGSGQRPMPQMAMEDASAG